MFSGKGLKFQLIALFLLFTIIPALLSGIVSNYLNMVYYKESTVHSNLTAARQTGNEIKRLLDSSQGLIEALAGSPAAKALDAAAVKELILSAQQANPHLELIFVMDATGMQFARTSGTLANRADRQYFKEAMKGATFFTDTYISSFTNAPTVTIAVPIKNNSGTVVGVFAADISLKAVWEIADRMHFGKTGYMDIVDNKGTVIAHPDKQRVLKKESFAELPYVKNVLNGQAGFVDAVSTRGDETLTVYAPVDKYKWGVIVHEPTAEVLAAVTQSIISLGLLILVSVLAAAAAAFYVARSIAGPLQALVGATDKVAQGDLSADIQVAGVKEVNELTAKFNAMVAVLRDLIAKTSAASSMVAAASEQLAASSGEVGKASQEVATTIQHVAEGASSQVELSGRSLSLIDHMSAGIRETDSAAQAVVEASNKSETSA
ncbi:MAG: methyl-accepting chemotaxis protein, partial [Negativicutes bacterium]|nr:methyl-accepting chemotaxis protein [Negativicutes bacterium]